MGSNELAVKARFYKIPQSMEAALLHWKWHDQMIRKHSCNTNVLEWEICRKLLYSSLPWPPVDLYMVFEKSSSKNCISSLQKSILILIFVDYTGSKNQVQK